MWKSCGVDSWAFCWGAKYVKQAAQVQEHEFHLCKWTCTQISRLVCVSNQINLHHSRQIEALINNMIMCCLKVHWLPEIFYLFQIYWRGGWGCQWPFPAETASRHHSSGSSHAQSPQRSPLGPYSSHQTGGTGRIGQTFRDEANVTECLTRRTLFRGRITSHEALHVSTF